MSSRLQTWLLANTKGLQFIINEKLATRPGGLGNFFKRFEIGERQLGAHTLGRALKVANYFYLATAQYTMFGRMTLSRFAGSTNGPLSYSGLFVYFFATCWILSRFQFDRARDVVRFNA